MESQEYSTMVQLHAKNKKDKEDRYKNSSKERLYKIASKKIQTTMIGALSTIESYFGFLWEQSSDEELTPEQEHMRELYEDARSEILDRGNHQIRNLETEMTNYDITWLRYHLNLPVVSKGSIKEGYDE